jgi:hypothetical protein
MAPTELRVPLLFELDGELPALAEANAGDRALFASRLGFGIDDDLLRYRATYRLEAGDVFPLAAPPGSEPTTLAGQRFGQDVLVTLPELAGAPVSLGVSAEAGDVWQLGGEAKTGSQRGHVEWSPLGATLRLDWMDRGQALDPALALRCELASSLGLPLSGGDDGGQLLRLTGGTCHVADGTPYAGIPVRAWGVGYVWSGAERESVARVRVIRPDRLPGILDVALEPAYQLGLRHRRDFGLLSAQAGLALRQPPSLAGDGTLLGPAAETSWSASASLTWHLAAASVSADWAQGVDPLWFIPAAHEARDRFGLAVDLSPWIETVVPGPVSELGLRWDWSRVRPAGSGPVAESSLALDVMLLF